MPPVPNADSLAWNYFQKYNGPNALEFIKTLKDRSETENEHLDFKLWNQDQNKVESDFSRTMCAFANTGGGVLIWGVKTKNVDRRDTVIDSPGVDEVVAKVAWLEERKKFISDPPISGIQIVSIGKDFSDRGFIVCYIPEGNNKPYRAERDKQQWYMRVGDESKIIPPSHLRQLFYPERGIRLRMSIQKNNEEPYRTTMEGAGVNPHFAVWTVTILNVGNQSMQNGLIRLLAPTGEFFRWVNPPSSDYRMFSSFADPLELHNSLHPWQAFIFILGIKFKDFMPRLRFDVFSKDAWPQSVMLKRGERLSMDAEFPLLPTQGSLENIIDVVEAEQAWTPHS